MAVTQQLARVPAEYLAACRQEAGASPDGEFRWNPPAEDVLDLDWAPVLLERVCALAGLDDVLLHGLRRATEGDASVDVGFLATPPYAIGPFGPAPAALSPAGAAHVSELLGQIDLRAVLATLPAEETEAAALVGDGADGIAGGLRKYLLEHFHALRDFYREASRRQLLLVLWWD
ncbi:DUF1877 domain-containing protein [Streptomyces sp. NPDC048612]|uniref:DUF1877 domain-containing protein n=1 Tax=Streptomyces sp. NPDC048612 TaxID=3365579 RepID=UPI00372270A5